MKIVLKILSLLVMLVSVYFAGAACGKVYGTWIGALVAFPVAALAGVGAAYLWKKIDGE